MRVENAIKSIPIRLNNKALKSVARKMGYVLTESDCREIRKTSRPLFLGLLGRNPFETPRQAVSDYLDAWER